MSHHCFLFEESHLPKHCCCICAALYFSLWTKCSVTYKVYMTLHCYRFNINLILRHKLQGNIIVTMARNIVAHKSKRIPTSGLRTGQNPSRF